MRKFLIYCVLIFCFSTITAVSANASEIASQWYQKGKLALSEKRYSAAVGNFKKAFDQGYDEAKLHHAWGAALYHTRRYKEAGKHFQKALEDPAFTQLAYLNLGLVALKQNQNDQAISWFLKAKEEGGSSKVSLLAEEMLQRMNDVADNTLLPEATIIYFLMRGGFEDQAYSVALDQVGGSDRFMEYNLYASTRLSGSDARGFNASFNGYSLQNKNSHETEVSVATIQVGYYKKKLQWRLNGSVGIAPTYVAGDPYTTALTADMQLKRYLFAKTTISGLLGYETAKAESTEVDYAAGQVFKSRLQLARNAGKGSFYITYQYEQHDRHDRWQGANFYSYSPTRHTLRFKHRYLLGQSWRTEIDLRYRHSEYTDPNLIGGEVKRRIENQNQVTFTLGYVMNKYATLRIGLEHTDNQSTWEQYTYRRNEYTVGVEWLFL